MVAPVRSSRVRRLRDYRDLRFISDQVLTGRLKSSGGAVVFEQSEPFLTARPVESVAPGQPYPKSDIPTGTAGLAAVSKWGQGTDLTDEDRPERLRRADRRPEAEEGRQPAAKGTADLRLPGQPEHHPGDARHPRYLRVGPQRRTALPDRRLRDRQVPPTHRLGHRGRDSGYRVRYVLAAKLVNELVEAADDKQLTKTIARYGRVDLLCIDELGYMELDRRGAELLFQVLTEREENNSMAIASNESFSGWTKTFTDPRLCAAIVDRLTFGGNIIETGTDSYRLAQTRARAGHATS